jgi:hypothetical protein
VPTVASRRSPPWSASKEPYRGSKNGRGLAFWYMDDPKVGTPWRDVLVQWRVGQVFGMCFPCPHDRMLVLFTGPAEDIPRFQRDAKGMWEQMLRQHRRLADRRDAISHPRIPSWRVTAPWSMGREQHWITALCREMAGRMARCVGTAAAVAAHVEDVTFPTPIMPLIPWPTKMVGESQIVERDGRILARMAYEDGEGYVAAEVRIAPPEPLDPVSPAFWMAPMPFGQHAAWQALNLQGRINYRRAKRARKFPWQAWPSSDLPTYTPRATAGSASAALRGAAPETAGKR